MSHWPSSKGLKTSQAKLCKLNSLEINHMERQPMHGTNSTTLIQIRQAGDL